ncbi:MAG: hypothetical protein ABI591_24170 [Kofleriaceae bacterium]
MRFVVGLALIAGSTAACVADHHGDPDPAPIVQPHTCGTDVTLDGSTGSAQPTQIGPLTLDQNGQTICLHLDATQNVAAAHFSATTDAQPGMVSAFATALQDDDFAILQDSWDVTVDTSQPQTFANLEWNAPLHVQTDAMLWIHARGQAASTMVSVALFEPLE